MECNDACYDGYKDSSDGQSDCGGTADDGDEIILMMAMR